MDVILSLKWYEFFANVITYEEEVLEEEEENGEGVKFKEEEDYIDESGQGISHTNVQTGNEEA